MDNFVNLVDALAWPAAVVIIALLVLSRSGQQLVLRLVGRIKRVSALGVEIELTPEAATRIKADLEETFRSYRATIISEFDRRASLRHVEELRRRVAEEAVVPNLNEVNGRRPSYRCTIHVRDILLHEAMYQLLDYLPAAGSGGAGQTFSMRFGIVGQAWRTADRSGRRTFSPVIPTW